MCTAFTLVDQFIHWKIAFRGLIGQSSSLVQYSSPVVQSSEWIYTPALAMCTDSLGKLLSWSVQYSSPVVQPI